MPLRAILKDAIGPLTYRDGLGLSLAILLACILRLVNPSGMSVEHFDEGVYASNIWSPAEQGGSYPLRHYYAPPLLPFLLELSILATGPQLGPLLPNLIIGSLTIALVWIVTRSWCGAGTAWVAAVLAASNDVHLLYSRTALTDVLLAAAILLAVWLTSVAVAYRRTDIAVLAGLATSVAWWTKYNGWLPLAIAIGGLGLWALCYQGWRIAGKNILYVICAMITTAFLGWLPFLWSLQSFPGGYSSVSANHASYLVGLSGWLTSLAQQHQTLREMDSLVGVVGISVAAALTLRDARRPTALKGMVFAAGGSLAAGLIAYLGGSSAFLFAGVLYFCVYQVWHSARTPRKDPLTAHEHCQQAGWCLLAVWLIGLSLTIPLYTPYPRLTIAWLLPAWIATASTLRVASHALTSAADDSWRRRKRGVLAVGLFCFAAGIAVWQTARSSTKPFPVAWEDRTGVKQVATALLDNIQKSVPEETQTLVFVCGEPAIYYQLNALISQQSRPIACLPIAQPTFDRPPPPNVPTFVVVGPFARTTEGYAAAFTHPDLRLIQEHTCQVSTLMMANLAPPPQWKSQAEQHYELYRWQRP